MGTNTKITNRVFPFHYYLMNRSLESIVKAANISLGRTKGGRITNIET